MRDLLILIDTDDTVFLLAWLVCWLLASSMAFWLDVRDRGGRHVAKN